MMFSCRPYDIDPSVQLVCKYLNAYEKRTDEKKGINKLFSKFKYIVPELN